MRDISKFTRINKIENRGADGFWAVLDVSRPYQRLKNGRLETTRSFNEQALRGQVSSLPFRGEDVSLQRVALKHVQRAAAARDARMSSSQSNI